MSRLAPTSLIISWAVLGTLWGGGLGLITRRLLRTGRLTPGAWTTSAAITGVLFAVLAWQLGSDFVLLPYSYLAAVLVPLAIVDLVEHRLPSVLVLPSYAVVGATFGVEAVLEGTYPNLLRSLAGMVVLAAAYLLLALTSGGLGAGDVKLAGLLGLALGWLSWTALLTGTFLGWLLAAMVRAALTMTGRIGRGEPMPLGPCLALGTLTTVVLGLSTSP